MEGAANASVQVKVGTDAAYLSFRSLIHLVDSRTPLIIFAA